MRKIDPITVESYRSPKKLPRPRSSLIAAIALIFGTAGSSFQATSCQETALAGIFDDDLQIQKDDRTAKRKRETFFAELFDPSDDQDEDDGSKLMLELAALPEDDRIAAIRFGLSNFPEKTVKQAESLLDAVAGLDPGKRIRRRLADTLDS